MVMTEQQTPHEFLVRWDDHGNLQGAHLVQRIAYVDGGAEVFSKFGDPQGVSLSDATLLAQISDAINTAALADGVTKAAQIAQMQSDLGAAQAATEAAQQAKTQAENETGAALAQVSELQAQLGEFQTPVDGNGVPVQVTKRQGVQALIDFDYIDLVQPAIDSIADAKTRATMQNEWTNSTAFQRQRPSLIALAAAIGVDSARLDQLFIYAATK